MIYLFAGQSACTHHTSRLSLSYCVWHWTKLPNCCLVWREEVTWWWRWNIGDHTALFWWVYVVCSNLECPLPSLVFVFCDSLQHLLAILQFLVPMYTEFRPGTFFRSASWRMTRVIKPDQLGKPFERLREQMKKLELSTGEGEVMLPCINVFSLMCRGIGSAL